MAKIDWAWQAYAEGGDVCALYANWHLCGPVEFERNYTGLIMRGSPIDRSLTFCAEYGIKVKRAIFSTIMDGGADGDVATVFGLKFDCEADLALFILGCK